MELNYLRAALRSHRAIRWFAIIVGLLAYLFAAAEVAAAQSRDGLVQPQLLIDTNSIEAGKPFTVGVLFNVADNWHIYWSNPGDAGAPTTLKIAVPAGFTVGPVQYPVPEVLEEPGPLTLYVYQKQALLMAQVTPPANLSAINSIPVTVHAGWCVCSDVCIIGKKDLGATLRVVDSGQSQPANTDVFNAWRSRLPVPASQVIGGWSISSSWSQINMSENRQITLRWLSSPLAGVPQWIPDAREDLTVKSTSISTDNQQTLISLSIQPVQGIASGSSTISGILAYYQPGQPPHGVAVAVTRNVNEVH